MIEKTMKTLETVAREIERQMYGQLNHCAIYESDLQRLCPQLLEIGIARVSYRCQSRIANRQCQKTVGHADLHFHNSFGSWPRRRRQIKPLVEKRKPQPTVRPEYHSQPDAPNCSKKVFGKVVPAKQRHAQSERMKGYWRHRQAAGRTDRIKPHEPSPAVRNSKRFNALCATRFRIDKQLRPRQNVGADRRSRIKSNGMTSGSGAQCRRT